MSDQNNEEVFLTSAELTAKYPKIFPKTRLDLWARKKLAYLSSNPEGRAGSEFIRFLKLKKYWLNPP